MARKKVVKKGKKEIDEVEKQKAAEELEAKRKAEEDERRCKWEEDWEKKLKAKEELDNIKCCVAEGLCLKPRTQSNIWINVTVDKTTQDIQMAFKHTPVPKPKPPPLPPLKRDLTPEAEPVEKILSKAKKGRRKGGKKK